MKFVDTNYFLRYLLQDIPAQYETAERLFLRAANGKVKLVTSLVVMFELYWVLSSFYGQQKKQVADILEQVLDLDFILLAERPILQESLALFRAKNISLEDCYNVIFSKTKEIREFKTFDKKLTKTFKEYGLRP